MAKLALFLGCLAIAIIIGGLVWANAIPSLGGLPIAFGSALVTAAVAVAGIVVAVRARHRGAGPRWMTTVGIVLDIVALLPTTYLVVGFIAIMIQFSSMPALGSYG